jgi:hypothetical protein
MYLKLLVSIEKSGFLSRSYVANLQSKVDRFLDKKTQEIAQVKSTSVRYEFGDQKIFVTKSQTPSTSKKGSRKHHSSDSEFLTEEEEEISSEIIISKE